MNAAVYDLLSQDVCMNKSLSEDLKMRETPHTGHDDSIISSEFSKNKKFYSIVVFHKKSQFRNNW